MELKQIVVPEELGFDCGVTLFTFIVLRAAKAGFTGESWGDEINASSEYRG